MTVRERLAGPALRAARWWVGTASLRVRIAVAAGVTVAIALSLGAIALSVVHRWQLTDNLDESLAARAEDISMRLQEGQLSPVLTVRDSEEALIQVIGADGAVIAASANVVGERPLVPTMPASLERSVRTVEDLPIDEGEFRVLQQRDQVGGASYVVIVAETTEPITESAAILRGILLVVVPALVALVVVITWIVVGRSLAPVEAIRAEVASISTQDLRRRVPEPARADEIGRLARTMNAMLARLERGQQLQQEFVADASHELRSPLTSIRAQIEVDLAGLDQADPVATERSVLEEALRLERLVDDLLELARGEAATPGAFAPVDLDDLVLDEARRARSIASVEIDTSAVSGAQIVGDAGQLSRAVRNLVENAIRHAASRVAIELHEGNGVATLIVTDDGPGIPPAERARVFERFYRIDAARARQSGGTGLGLAITREIAARHGGEVFVADSVAGARLVMRLPLEGPRR